MAKRKRSSKGHFLPAVAKANKPAKARKTRKKGRRKGRRAVAARAPRGAKRNPPTTVVRETLSVGGAAIMGGLAAHAAVKVMERIASPGVADVARILVPTLIGIAATQLDHRHSQAIAAGAFGVAGAAVAGSIADAIAKPNPPRADEFWLDNPPTDPDELAYQVNNAYRNGISALLAR